MYSLFSFIKFETIIQTNILTINQILNGTMSSRVANYNQKLINLIKHSMKTDLFNKISLSLVLVVILTFLSSKSYSQIKYNIDGYLCCLHLN